MKNSVLLIDDDCITNIFNEALLKKSISFNNYIKCTDAQCAIDVVESNNIPKIILLDWHMPDFNGMQFLKEIEKRGICEKTFIFVLSSTQKRSEIELIKNHKYVIEFIPKPLSQEKIKKFILNNLSESDFK